jgi:predicted acetyltransferase
VVACACAECYNATMTNETLIAPGRPGFFTPGDMVDGDLALVLESEQPGDPARGLVPTYYFRMVRLPSGEEVGQISLRIGSSPHILFYAGHVGYGVHPEQRGHHFAARSCRLLLPLARAHGFRTLWITCNPDNTGSRRTCELAGARFVEIVDLPEDSEMYLRGERQKCRYRLDL